MDIIVKYINVKSNIFYFLFYLIQVSKNYNFLINKIKHHVIYTYIRYLLYNNSNFIYFITIFKTLIYLCHYIHNNCNSDIYLVIKIFYLKKQFLKYT